MAKQTGEAQMGSEEPIQRFVRDELMVVNEAVAVAEELTSNAYKMSFAEWRGRRYDIKTVADLSAEEIVSGHFAQIIRYVGRKAETSLGSSRYDFYKICLQDHNILGVVNDFAGLRLFSFSLYVVCHELIHVIRFTRFMQAFDASPEERVEEEARVHELTRSIVEPASIEGMGGVFEFYRAWREPLDRVQCL
jgi:hypothetical protein